MVWPAIIAAAAAAAQGAGNLWSGNHAARKAWSRAKEAAQNAHQWEVNDLRAAGLNPILSATGGSGASAQPFMATAPAIDAVSSAEKGMASAKLQSDMDNAKAITDAQVAQLNAGTAKMYNDMANDGYRLQNELRLGDSTVSLNASHENLNAQQGILAGANAGLVRGKTAQLPFERGLLIAQKGAADAAAVASRATARYSNANAFGQEMTNKYYSDDPSRIDYRETSKAFGGQLGAGYTAIDKVGNQLGNWFRNWFSGATPPPVKGYSIDYSGDK